MLLGSLLIAVPLVTLSRFKQENAQATDALLFTKLGSASGRVDLGFLLVRSLGRALAIAVIPVSAKIIAVKIILLAYDLVGAPPMVLQGNILIFSYSLGLFLASDFSRFLVHRLMHRIPALWRFHQVHHSAESLTPFSLYRVHPVEQMIQAGRGLLVVGLVAGLFGWLSLGKASVATYYGIPTTMYVFNLLGANLRHSHVWLRYPNWLERVFISPAQHQLHHDAEATNQHANLGAMLSVWDKFFGSLILSTPTGQPQTFGLKTKDRNHDPSSLISSLLGPLGIKTGPGKPKGAKDT